MEIVKIQGDHNRMQGVYYEYDRHSQPLGEGGMGRIYQGYRVDEYSGSRIYVAIKEINDELSRNPQIIERAQREASIQIEHDNLLRIYDFVANVEYLPLHDTNIVRYYMIMERIVGVNVDQLMAGNLTDKSGIFIPMAQELYTQYCSNREYAVYVIMKNLLSGIMTLHNSGYIHRDIDPSNIMITYDNKIKLIDFGVCKQIGAAPERQLTSAGSFIGKVNYAAPELAFGDVNLQNQTTDIYALGILMYQLLVGSLPFTGSNQDILKQQVNDKLPLKKIAHKGFRRIVEKATEKRQEKRYALAVEMLSDIEKAFMAKGGNSSSGLNTAVGGNTEASTGGVNQGLIRVEKSIPVWVWPVSAVAGLVIGFVIKILVH